MTLGEPDQPSGAPKWQSITLLEQTGASAV
jgi:hypothetical protein